MTTLLSVGAGAIVLRNTSGNIIFDSSEKLFQATSQHTGTKVCGSWTASYDGAGNFTDVNTDTTHSLATINANCDTVVGAFKVSVSSGSQGVSGLGWYAAGGTYVHFLDESGGGSRSIAQCMAGFTFRATGGSLVLHERVILRAIGGVGAPANSITLQQTTFEYNLYVGSFV